MKGLRIEFGGEALDPVRRYARAPGAPDLARREILEIMLGHADVLTNHAPRATAMALTMPKAASATPSAMKIGVTPPPARSPSQPPPAASVRRRKLASSGQSRRPAPCEAK